MKTVRYLSLMLFAGLLLSCSNWLDVHPEDDIDEKELFSKGEGYRTALNGVYRMMAGSELYGKQLSWGVLDAMGQCYTVSKTNQIDIDDAASYEYTSYYTKPVVERFWTTAYNAVANCNNILRNVQVADPDLFEYKEQERRLIEGEALALRAFIQFDMLRLFAPSLQSARVDYSKMPYLSKYPTMVPERFSVRECLDFIIRDLNDAKALVFEFDSVNVERLKANQRFYGMTGIDRFLFSRGYRMNYYAICGALARVCLYAERYPEAYAAAKEVIDFNARTSYFRFSMSSSISQGNIKHTEDLIFGLYSPMQEEWDREVNDVVSDITGELFFLALNDYINPYYDDKVFGDEWKSDYRHTKCMEEFNYYYRSLKNRPGTKKESQQSLQTVPMLRLSEMYYIAGEAIYESSPEEAKIYLNDIKRARGIYSADLSGIEDLKTYRNALQSEYWREFIGEGQLFFFCKRLNREIWFTDKLPSDEIFVLPMPESETDFN